MNHVKIVREHQKDKINASKRKKILLKVNKSSRWGWSINSCEVMTFFYFQTPELKLSPWRLFHQFLMVEDGYSSRWSFSSALFISQSDAALSDLQVSDRMNPYVVVVGFSAERRRRRDVCRKFSSWSEFSLMKRLILHRFSSFTAPPQLDYRWTNSCCTWFTIHAFTEGGGASEEIQPGHVFLLQSFRQSSVTASALNRC